MEQPHRVRLFDEWARGYDQSVKKAGEFPFDGYERVLDEIARAAGAHTGMTVLDLGVGTGNLAARFAALECDLWGMDFSSEMLAKARERLPRAVLVQADLLRPWPNELARRFDRIVSAYVLHEFDLATQVHLLCRLAEGHLSPGGMIVIGDVAFSTTVERERAHGEWEDLWDEDEHYWAADEAAEACEIAGLHVTYTQVSRCGGVFVMEPLRTGHRAG
ncbi:class I SAM-dependent methyltransferase [Candidatus Fermentibacteria bacterium]|nr:class I SAM-dependent methyltransferase [Candidatus Fermentibacteria bacterium]